MTIISDPHTEMNILYLEERIKMLEAQKQQLRTALHYWLKRVRMATLSEPEIQQFAEDVKLTNV